jgi:hypothetical protein
VEEHVACGWVIGSDPGRVQNDGSETGGAPLAG